jgi:hypothetical protein
MVNLAEKRFFEVIGEEVFLNIVSLDLRLKLNKVIRELAH